MIFPHEEHNTNAVKMTTAPPTNEVSVNEVSVNEVVTQLTINTDTEEPELVVRFHSPTSPNDASPSEVPSSPSPPPSSTPSPPPPLLDEQYIKRINKLLKHIKHMYDQSHQLVQWSGLSAGHSIDLYNFKQVWHFMIGHYYTLSSFQYQQLASLCHQVHQHYIALYQEFMNITDYLKTVGITKQTLKNVYMCYKYMLSEFQHLKEVTLELPDFIVYLQSHAEPKEVNYANYDNASEAGEQGIEWLMQLLKLYDKLDGETPVSPERLMKCFRYRHESLADADHTLLCTILESQFGCESFAIICANFRHWLTAHLDSLPPFVADCFVLYA